MDDESVVVARIARAHGIHGGLLLAPETDHAEELFVPGRVLSVLDPPPAAPARLTIVEASPHQARWRIRVEEIADRTVAESLQGVYVAVGREELPALEEGEYFLHDLVGLQVEEEGRPLGTIGDVYELPAGPMLAVEADGREWLIPFRPEMVREVDLEAGVVRVELPEGLLDI